jgi:hypothetical protein
MFTGLLARRQACYHFRVACHSCDERPISLSRPLIENGSGDIPSRRDLTQRTYNFTFLPMKVRYRRALIV